MKTVFNCIQCGKEIKESDQCLLSEDKERALCFICAVSPTLKLSTIEAMIPLHRWLLLEKLGLKYGKAARSKEGNNET